ncbi:F0F1 ATP synthase subunit delta [Fructilactobacillus lindneri]|uniref:ATP synthase subunit delta n=2 Tax=Fructilactobacillus lindneri TaxID=53444 RepID=A0A0R2JXN0_9LACO|nr:ATP synthase F1 subunit delta [Fructilactobacillus lindneri]ANZ58371.1 F0F1 ATP synthase subunit delta [Fructilactobacillus lindneri]ANZ59693.1 F0F1 ATP synthase subunit delta [Fructilactobacillus lindneri]KRN79207.1 ATP synthase subunit delta [Fructilactobacillus lindneri DSM 20690 = JCM 11027]POG98524.1 F0F1 ATP synthase subunit delta [Fructilactobacillus lindneri]POH03912.1 F0F1 ATP synthase subunit delta [Fructilactobacillus lindneri]
MSLSKLDVAKNYSKALYEALENENSIDKGKADLDAIKIVFDNDPELAAALNGVSLDTQQKETLLNPLIDGATSEYVRNLINMLFDYGRISDLVAVIDEFDKLYNQKNGIVKAEAVTAVPLDEDEKSKLAQSLGKRINAKKVELSTKINPDIIGGVILKSSDVVYDGSIRTKIEQVKRLLLK